MRVVFIVVFEILYLLCKALFSFLMYTEGNKHAIRSYILLIAGKHVKNIFQKQL